MHVHLPKPLHGWREFLGEVGVIVIGVLIALGAEQIVETLHWREKASEADAEIRHEFALAAAVAQERTLIQPCLAGRIAILRGIVADARRTGQLPDVAFKGRAPFRPFEDSAWRSAIADGTASHLPTQTREIASIQFGLIADQQQRMFEERRLWSRVSLLTQSPGPISQPMLATIAGDLSDLAILNQSTGVVAQQTFDYFTERGIVPDYEYYKPDIASGAELYRLLKNNCTPVLVNGKPAAPPATVPPGK